MVVQGFFSGGWLKTKIARGSQRFLSVPFSNSTVTKAVQIENIHGAYPVCLVAPVKAGDAPVTIDDVIRDLDQLETTPAPRPTHDLARLETALRDLRAQDETQDVLQSLVRLYCLYQVNHGQNFRNFEDWSNGEKSRGNALLL